MSVNNAISYILQKNDCLTDNLIGATTLWDPWDAYPPTLENQGTRWEKLLDLREIDAEREWVQQRWAGK